MKTKPLITSKQIKHLRLSNAWCGRRVMLLNDLVYAEHARVREKGTIIRIDKDLPDNNWEIFINWDKKWIVRYNSQRHISSIQKMAVYRSPLTDNAHLKQKTLCVNI